MTTQQPEEPSVMDQAQDGDAGQVSRSGLYPTKDDQDDNQQASSGGDDPELAGADLDEDQSEGRGPTIEPGA
ncbi:MULTISPECIES: hypothetical protein [Arsenicicoccus]|uniref:hypothetical protein n=2 Tax=Intrasporangiaceae TaxID=85021 RepID=UPI000492238B|nr:MULTISPECIES: hypothetical protein [Arsenicicoccus]